MKNLRRCAVVLLLTLAACLTSARAFAIDLVRDGKTVTVVVLTESPSEVDRLAGQELAGHLKLITGSDTEVVNAADPEAAAAKAREDGLTPILIGAAAGEAATSAFAQATEIPDSFLLAVNEQDVRIVGLGQGVRFGVSELLEQIGVRWFMPGTIGMVLPEGKHLVVAEQQTVQSPAFSSRHFQGLEGEWKIRLRCGGPNFPTAHGLPGISPRMFEQYPQYFSLVNGKRTTRQVCVSNPDVVNRVTEATRALYRKSPGRTNVGMGPNDGSGFCECENCRALDGDDFDPLTNEPAVTDRYIWLFNQVLEGIEEEFPDKKVGFYIYHNYMRPPVRHTPHRNITGALAPISLCRIHGPNNPLCPEKDYYATLMKQWCDVLGGQVWERGYWSNLADPGFSFINIHRLREQIPIAKQANLRGWRVETFAQYGTQLPSFYIAAKLMWNVDADVDALVRDFAEKFYGPASEPMEAYTWLMNDTLRDADFHTGCSWDLPNIYTAEVRQKAKALLDQAAKLTEEKSVYAQRVEIAAECFALTDHFVRMMDARTAMDLAKAGEELKLLDASAKKLLSADPPMVDPRTFKAYMDRFYRLPTEQGAARVTGGNRLLAACGDEWQFQIDPTALGETFEWFRTDVSGGNWQSIRTTSQSWSNQGLRYYKGIAWYRKTVTLPADVQGQRVFLWSGGVDEKARVWINGKEIGISHGAAFYPFEMDATEAVQPGENVVVIEVSNQRVDELGTGGLVAPVILYIPKDGKDAKLENVRDLKLTFP